MSKLGFGFLRLPLNNPLAEKDINYRMLFEMVDIFMNGGGTYFDTAYTYHAGHSEIAFKKAVSQRYARDKFTITDKIPAYRLNSYEEMEKVFNEQLDKCGVSYFDNYFIHWLSSQSLEHVEKIGAFELLKRKKEAGIVRKIGFSYHDSAQLLDEILSAHPEMDYVQIQLNYLDWESEQIQSRKCCEVINKHMKKIIVMEPVKGGMLAKHSGKNKELITSLNKQMSDASYAIRFAASQNGVEYVLSGMSDIEQVKDNISYMRNFKPLSAKETKQLLKIAENIRSDIPIPCTKCGYCMDNCPKGIPIPHYFSLYNSLKGSSRDPLWKLLPLYKQITNNHNSPGECVKCFNCESNCPQKIKITQWLEMLAGEFKE